MNRLALRGPIARQVLLLLEQALFPLRNQLAFRSLGHFFVSALFVLLFLYLFLYFSQKVIVVLVVKDYALVGASTRLPIDKCLQVGVAHLLSLCLRCECNLSKLVMVSRALYLTPTHRKQLNWITL